MSEQPCVHIPVEALDSVTRAIAGLRGQGITDLFVVVTPGRAELCDRRSGSYGASTWNVEP